MSDNGSVMAEMTTIYVSDSRVVLELALDGGQVHGALDDLLVLRELLRVDRQQERPRVLVTLHLTQQAPGRNMDIHVA